MQPLEFWSALPRAGATMVPLVILKLVRAHFATTITADDGNLQDGLEGPWKLKRGYTGV